MNPGGWRRNRMPSGLRARMIQAIRQFFYGRDYLEVETPLRIPAPAPEEHIDAPPSGDWFLQTSPELCMKRLLAAGYSKIFQISKCFREAERGHLHLPEFTLLEWYRQGLIIRSSCRNARNSSSMWPVRLKRVMSFSSGEENRFAGALETDFRQGGLCTVFPAVYIGSPGKGLL